MQDMKPANAQTQALLDSLNRSSLVITFDAATGRSVAANAFAQSILGFDAKTIAETDLSAQIVEEEEGSFTKAWATALGGEAAPVQCGLRKLNGNSVPTIGDLTFCPNKAGGGQVFLVARVDAPLDNMLELKGRAKAIDRSQVVVEFDLDGNVLTANDNFLELMGYSLGEISGKHHSMFCDEDFTGSSAYSGSGLSCDRARSLMASTRGSAAVVVMSGSGPATILC